MGQVLTKAARVRQGNLTLYTTGICVRDLVKPNFYSVETLDPTDASDGGYQRTLGRVDLSALSTGSIGLRDCALPH